MSLLVVTIISCRCCQLQMLPSCRLQRQVLSPMSTETFSSASECLCCKPAVSKSSSKAFSKKGLLEYHEKHTLVKMNLWASMQLQIKLSLTNECTSLYNNSQQDCLIPQPVYSHAHHDISKCRLSIKMAKFHEGTLIQCQARSGCRGS